jgi:hypothetical protein
LPDKNPGEIVWVGEKTPGEREDKECVFSLFFEEEISMRFPRKGEDGNNPAQALKTVKSGGRSW